MRTYKIVGIAHLDDAILDAFRSGTGKEINPLISNDELEVIVTFCDASGDFSQEEILDIIRTYSSKWQKPID